VKPVVLFVPPVCLFARILGTIEDAVILGAMQRGGRLFEYGEGIRVKFRNEI